MPDAKQGARPGYEISS